MRYLFMRLLPRTVLDADQYPLSTLVNVRSICLSGAVVQTQANVNLTGQ